MAEKKAKGIKAATSREESSKSKGKSAAKSAGRKGKSGGGASNIVEEEEGKKLSEHPSESYFEKEHNSLFSTLTYIQIHFNNIFHVVVKTVVVKGKAPVDPECTAKLGTAHVFVEGNDIYDVMLNQVS